MTTELNLQVHMSAYQVLGTRKSCHECPRDTILSLVGSRTLNWANFCLTYQGSSASPTLVILINALTRDPAKSLKTIQNTNVDVWYPSYPQGKNRERVAQEYVLVGLRHNSINCCLGSVTSYANKVERKREQQILIGDC